MDNQAYHSDEGVNVGRRDAGKKSRQKPSADSNHPTCTAFGASGFSSDLQDKEALSLGAGKCETALRASAEALEIDSSLPLPSDIGTCVSSAKQTVTVDSESKTDVSESRISSESERGSREKNVGCFLQVIRDESVKFLIGYSSKKRKFTETVDNNSCRSFDFETDSHQGKKLNLDVVPPSSSSFSFTFTPVPSADSSQSQDARLSTATNSALLSSSSGSTSSSADIKRRFADVEPASQLPSGSCLFPVSCSFWKKRAKLDFQSSQQPSAVAIDLSTSKQSAAGQPPLLAKAVTNGKSIQSVPSSSTNSVRQVISSLASGVSSVFVDNSNSLAIFGKESLIMNNQPTSPSGSQPVQDASAENSSDPSETSSIFFMTSSDTESEEREVTRLQALLEARGHPAQFLGGFGSRMQQLSERAASSAANGKQVQDILLRLESSKDEGELLASLIELCQLLVMGNEETLAGFPIRQAVPVLIKLLRMEHNFDIMHQACRALTYLMEGLPRSSPVVVDAVPLFLEKLQSIECMDVAEQSLRALEILSKKHNKAILQRGGVAASLMFIDFFSITAQRSALAITANCCLNMTVEEFCYVQDSLPVITNRLTNQDKKLVESACLCLARLVDNYQTEERLLKEIAVHGLLTDVQQLLFVSPPIISTSTLVTVLHMLVVMCYNCPDLAIILLKLNVAETISYLLVGTSDKGRTSGSPELIPRSPQELFEIVSLIGELMPLLPSDGLFAVDALFGSSSIGLTKQSGIWQWKDDNDIWRSYNAVDNRIIEMAHQSGELVVSLSSMGRAYIIDFVLMQQINEDTGTTRIIQRKVNSTNPRPEVATVKSDSRADVLYENSDLANGLTTTLFALLFEVYNSSAALFVRHKCLRTLLRMLYYGGADLLSNVLQSVAVSSDLAAMLSSNDLQTVVCAIQTCSILMSKLPDIFSIYFRRQGVLHQMNKLVQSTVIDLSMKKKTSPSSAPASACVSPSAFAPFVATSAAKPVSPAPEKSSKETSKPSSPGSQLRLSDVLKRKKPVRKASKKSGKADDDSSETNSSSASSQGASTSRSGPTTSHGRLFSMRDSRVGNLTPKTFLASLNPSRWGRSSQSVSDRPLVTRKTSLTKSPTDLNQPAVNNREMIKQWMTDHAAWFIDKYFDGDVKGLNHPSLAIFNQLCSSASFIGQDDPHSDATYLHQVANLLSLNDISPFEVIHSGLIKKLLSYFTSPSVDPYVIENRLRTFVRIFIGQPNLETENGSGQWQLMLPPPLLHLVNKLMACFHHLEQFQIKVHDHRDANNSRGFQVMQVFHSHHIKCNLQPHPSCTGAKLWKGGEISIDPFAPIQTIERYVIAKGFGKTIKNFEDSDDDDDDDDDLDDDEQEEEEEEEEDDDEDVLDDIEIDNALADSSVSLEVGKHVLEFCIGDQVVPYHMTIYQAVKQFARTPESNDADVDSALPLEEGAIWRQTHNVWYRPVSVITDNRTDGGTVSEKRKSERNSKLSSTKLAAEKFMLPDSLSVNRLNVLKSSLALVLPSSVTVEDPALEVLALLRILHTLNSEWTAVFDTGCSNTVLAIGKQEFVSNKLTAKANRQLQDPVIVMSGHLPQWLMQLANVCPFLLPFEIRLLLFCATSLDRDRAVQRIQELAREPTVTDNGERQAANRLERKKKIISRDDLLKQAEAAINELIGSKAVLEIQYENEVGSGLGPTLEFYALVSQELQRADLELWRGGKRHLRSKVKDCDEEDLYMYSPCGLFPTPLPKNVKSHVLRRIKSKFSFLGKFMARALIDSRILDLPLCPLFYKWLLGEESTLCISDLQFLDQDLFSSISKLHDVLREKQKIEADVSNPSELQRNLLENVTLDGCRIEDLGLDFTLPGYPNIELRKGGRDVTVTLDNIEEYIQLVVKWSLVYGVQHQFEAFRDGFASVFSLHSLSLFFIEEMDQLFCGSQQECWSVKYLTEVCQTDHGYTHDSQAVRHLFSILSSYSQDDQRLFLQFVTGSPRLPVGGLRSLSPPLTIVRKTDAREYADEFLPSVMTCVNYLKLPDYSSIEVMREKLAIAIREGQLSFHLS